MVKIIRRLKFFVGYIFRQENNSSLLADKVFALGLQYLHTLEAVMKVNFIYLYFYSLHLFLIFQIFPSFAFWNNARAPHLPASPFLITFQFHPLVVLVLVSDIVQKRVFMS